MSTTKTNKKKQAAGNAFGTLDSHLAKTNPRQFIVGLLDYAIDHNIGGVGPEDVQQAPPMIKAAIFINAFDLATSNSGIWEWFVESHDDYPKWINSFKKFARTAPQLTSLPEKLCFQMVACQRMQTSDLNFVIITAAIFIK